MRFNRLLHLVAFPWKAHGETSGIRFLHCHQDARIPCAFQVLRPVSPHTYPCQGFPPAFGEAQQAELRATVQELPTAAGIDLVNWELEGGPSVCLGTLRDQPVPQQLPELPAPAGVCLQAPQEEAAQGGTRPNEGPLWGSTPPCGTRRGALGLSPNPPKEGV